jgi:hypothetical protein
VLPGCAELLRNQALGGPGDPPFVDTPMTKAIFG